MKTNIILLILTISACSSSAQQEMNTENEFVSNDANHPCINKEQYKIIEQRCAANTQVHKSISNTQHSLSSVSLIWPLKAATGFNDCSFYFIAAYVDQDTNATTYKDYNCGSNTYDGHRGTDIAIEPFPFYKMDNDQVEVIAAAPGTIIDKHDGEYDRNCVGSGSNITANYIIVQHADGSVALYWHMKKNSLTAKTTGQTVVTGEKLGIVGSSGSSSGPHLHFEVWSGITSNTLVDPFTGSCNRLNNSSWWASQHSYLEPAVVKASVHTTDITFPPCGTTEVPNESTVYTIPFQGAGLNPGYAKFYVFLRDLTSGSTVNMSILKPDNSVYSSWSYNAATTYNFSYLNYSKLLPTVQGAYTFNATYNGVTCTQSFDILNPTGITETATETALQVYPNPVGNKITIQATSSVINEATVSLINVIGEVMRSEKINFISDPTIDISDLSSGIYFLEATDANGKWVQKFIKE